MPPVGRGAPDESKFKSTMTWGLGGRRERAEQEGDPEEERICRREGERERERETSRSDRRRDANKEKGQTRSGM